jgi:Ran GTPase-activating protein (RanGAP) involved in mRNA processing and transport
MHCFLPQLYICQDQLCGLSNISGKGTYTVEGITAIADALRVTPWLTSLSLRRNTIGDEGAAVIARSLKESKVSKLSSLDLNACGIRLAGAKELAAYLAVAASLTSCDVRWNNISGDGDGASQLSTAVLGNSKIEKFNEIPVKEMRGDSHTELDLSWKYIGIAGVLVVAGLLPSMSSLTKLDISWNFLKVEGVKVVRDAVRGRKGFALVDGSNGASQLDR